ncbi:phosphotransferase-like protein [Nonomuraea bangladeshensis]|uniref:phosphotransferase-like protein n=1 Tax=Nonomuraea bangladeshensis TaxID=404385 RepID=UPI003C2C1359
MDLHLGSLLGPVPERVGRLVLLNGTPSSGKTTVAKALQEELAEPFFHCSLDELRGGYQGRHWLQDHGGVLFRRVLDGYLHLLRSLTLLGHDVISEAVITPQMLDHYLALFEGIPVLFVGIRCPLEEVERRERGRTDRMTSAPPLDEPVHAHGCYDLEVDTSVQGPAEVAELISAALANPPVVSAFEQLRGRGRSGGDWRTN